MKNPITNQKGEVLMFFILGFACLSAISLAVRLSREPAEKQAEKQKIVTETRLAVQAENINKNWPLLHKGMNLDEVNAMVGPFPVGVINAGRASENILKKDEDYVLTHPVMDKTKRILKMRLTFKKGDLLLLDSWSLGIELSN